MIFDLLKYIMPQCYYMLQFLDPGGSALEPELEPGGSTSNMHPPPGLVLGGAFEATIM